MADYQNSGANNREDQTRPSGDWDKQYIAPPDTNMGAQDTTTQGRDAGSPSSHEYGGSPTDSRVSDSRSHTSHQRDSGSEAGLMGSAYDTEQQAQAGTPGSGANAPTSADMAGLNSSTGGATDSGENTVDNSVGGMANSNELGGVMQRDSMPGPPEGPGESTNPSASSAKPDHTQGDDRSSMIGDHADSAGRHDNPYDQAHPADENETPETMGGLSAESDATTLEGKSHLYTSGTTQEDFPAT